MSRPGETRRIEQSFFDIDLPRARLPRAQISRELAREPADHVRELRELGVELRAEATPLDLGRGSYFGRRRPEDGRIDWGRGAREIHDLVRAVAPPFPGAFTEVNGCRLAVLETRVDAQPARFVSEAPCLYAADGDWYADCVDGRRLKILRLAIGAEPVTPERAPPALARQPVQLS